MAGFYGHHSAVRSIAVAPNGSLVTSGDAEGHIIVWETQSRRELGMLSGQMGGVNALAISPDSKLAASGGDDSQVRIWTLDKLQNKSVLHGHDQAVTSLVFYPAGTHLLSGGRDGRIILWNLDTEKSVRQYSLPSGEVRCLAMMPGGIRFLSGDSTGLVRVWELATGREVMQFKVQKGAVNAAGRFSAGRPGPGRRQRRHAGVIGFGKQTLRRHMERLRRRPCVKLRWRFRPAALAPCRPTAPRACGCGRAKTISFWILTRDIPGPRSVRVFSQRDRGFNRFGRRIGAAVADAAPFEAGRKEDERGGR